MTEKFQNKYRIASVRYPLHDYDAGAYFITICTKKMKHYLGEISDGKMKLTPIGIFASQQMENLTRHYPYAEIPVFVVMPNHVHLLVFIEDERRAVACGSEQNDNMNRAVARNGSIMGARDINNRMSIISPKRASLPAVIRGIKSSVTKYANQNGIDFAWQSRYHDHIIRTQKEMNQIADYIQNNVINWQADKYSS